MGPFMIWLVLHVRGQDQPHPVFCMALVCNADGDILLTREYPQEKFLRKPRNNSFIDQASSVKMA